MEIQHDGFLLSPGRLGGPTEDAHRRLDIELLFELHLQRGELCEVLPQWRAEAMPAYALYPHRRHLSRRVRAFVDWLEQLLRARL